MSSDAPERRPDPEEVPPAVVPPPPPEEPPPPSDLRTWLGAAVGLNIVTLALLIAVLVTPGTFGLADEDSVTRAQRDAAAARVAAGDEGAVGERFETRLSRLEGLLAGAPAPGALEERMSRLEAAEAAGRTEREQAVRALGRLCAVTPEADC